MTYLLSFITLLSSLFLPKFHQITPVPTPSPTPPPPAHIVCVDPGHGNDDTGATYNGIDEKDVNLDIAMRLKNLLEKNKYGVVMTRTDDTTDATNSERAQICNNSHANALISIHLNYNNDTTMDYTQGLYGENPDKDQKFAEVIHQALVSGLNMPDGDTTDFNDNIMNKAAMPATLQETVFLTSDDEYSKLSDRTGARQEEIAQALFNGINSWFTQNLK